MATTSTPSKGSKGGNKLSIFTSQLDITKVNIERPGLSKGHNSSYDLTSHLNRSYPMAGLSPALAAPSSTGKTNWKPGHRKTNSYEATALLLNQIKSSTLSTTTTTTSSSQSARNMRVNLIDDSPAFSLEADALSLGSLELRTPRLDMAGGFRSFASDEDLSFANISGSGDSSFELAHFRGAKEYFYRGIISRKVSLKNGKKPSIALWYNNFMAVTRDAVHIFSSKSCPLNGVSDS